MSKFGYGKKKYFGNSRSEGSSNKLYNGGRNSQKDRDKGTDKGESFNNKQPTILIKAREKQEESTDSPKKTLVQNDTNSVINNTSSSATSTTDSTTAPAQPKYMTKSVKFLEDGLLCPEHVQDFLLDNNDFLIVGIAGGQGSGKSTILNLLAQREVTPQLKRELFKDSTVNVETDLSENLSKLKLADKSKKSTVFKIETPEDIESNRHCTNGIDIYITENRTIFLDCQPFLSVSVLDDLMKSDIKRSNIVSEFLPTENSGEIQSLQLLAFLMNVCHVLLFVQDSFVDSNVIRILKTAEILKPSLLTPDEDSMEHFPHLMFVHNKADMEFFFPDKFKVIQQMYRTMFKDTKLHIETGLGIGHGNIINYFNPENCGDPINLYLLPDYNNKTENLYGGHPPLEVLVKEFRCMVLESIKYSITHVQLTEKNWLSYCGKVWDQVKKSSFFVEYTKLMT